MRSRPPPPSTLSRVNAPETTPLERFVEAREAVEPRLVDLGESRLTLFEVDELAEAQIGYAVDPDDEDITGDAPGQWRPLWLVVGEEDAYLDTLLVDLADARLPVLVAAEDADGGWAPVEVAASFGALAALLAEVAAAPDNAARQAAVRRHAEQAPAAGRGYWLRWAGLA